MTELPFQACHNRFMRRNSFATAAFLIFGSVCFAQTDHPPLDVCTPEYYAKIAHVSRPHYLLGKPQNYENEWDPSGASFVSVSCRLLQGTNLTLVNLKLRNAKGEIGEVEAGSDRIPLHITTEVSIVQNGKREHERNAAEEADMKQHVGETVVFGRKFGSVPAGLALTFLSLSSLPAGYWQFEISLGRSRQTQIGTASDWNEHFREVYTPAEFARFRLVDQRAIRLQVWEYGMSKGVLFMLWGLPDHINDYDGEEQLVYGQGSSRSYFYFDRQGRLTHHQSSD